MKMPTAKLAYTGAGLTVLAAVLVPFLLMGAFTKAFSSMGLHVDEMYSGGPKLRTIQREGYTIDVHRPVAPHMLQTEKPFVQMAWKPVKALPARVNETVDVDGDGRPDIRVSFDVPQDAKVPLRVNAEPLNETFERIENVSREKFSSLIVRVDDEILVRVPLAKH